MSYKLGHFFVIISSAMIYLSVPQLIFCIIIPILALAVIGVFLYIFVFKKHIKSNFKKHCYRKIASIARLHDYYLINDFTFNSDDVTKEVVDHILFGNKYIFVILDRYIDGDLTGKDTDSDLVVISSNGSKTYAGGNPYILLNQLLRKLSVNTGISSELMIGITLINDESRICISSSSKQFFVCQRKRIAKLIKIIESRDIGKLNAESLEKAVNVLAKINARDK